MLASIFKRLIAWPALRVANNNKCSYWPVRVNQLASRHVASSRPAPSVSNVLRYIGPAFDSSPGKFFCLAFFSLSLRSSHKTATTPTRPISPSLLPNPRRLRFPPDPHITGLYTSQSFLLSILSALVVIHPNTCVIVWFHTESISQCLEPIIRKIFNILLGENGFWTRYAI